MSTVIFTFPHGSMISAALLGKEKRFADVQYSGNLRGFFGSASHTTTTKIKAARNNKLPALAQGWPIPAFIWT